MIHRDLKPGNILVSGEGRVKLLDFGIAKVLSAEEGGLDDLTRTGLRIMTPAYASPEQIRGDRVTTAADVYSLGVLLYELLTGRRPIHFEGLSPREIEQAIVSTNPSRPSTELEAAVTSSGGVHGPSTPEEIGSLRRSDPARLRRRLSGDLDNICLVALRKEPDRRYATAGHLLDDLERHLAGLPVRARADTLGYRLGKFWQRNRVGVATASAALFLTIALVVFYTIRLTSERDKARSEAEKAKAVSDFLSDLFEVADPTKSRGVELTARQMLDSGVQRVRTALADQPETQAEMYMVMGNTYRNLGLYSEALPLFEDALRIRRDLLGAEHPDVVTSYSRLADIMYYTGLLDSSRAMIRRIIPLRRKLYGSEDSSLGLELNNLGWIDYELGDLASAETLHTQALAIRRQVFGDDHWEVAESMSNLASIYYGRAEYERAEGLFRQALEMRIRLLGEDHPEVVASLNNLGLALEALDSFEGALQCYDHAIALCRKLYGEGHQMADPYSFRARVNMRLDLYHRAEPDFREALRLRRLGLGDEHYLVGYDWKNLAESLERQKRYAAADSAFDEALAIFHKVDPEGTSYTASALLGKGRMFMQVGRAPQAESLFREAVRVRERDLAADDWETAHARSHLGWCLARQGRFEEAEPILLKAYVRLNEVHGGDYRLTRETAFHLAELYEAWRKPDLFAHYQALATQPPSGNASE